MSSENINWSPIYCYIFETEVDKIEPPLPFLDDDNWFAQLLPWIVSHYDNIKMWTVWDAPIYPEPTTEQAHKVLLKEVWFGSIPASKLDDQGECIACFEFKEGQFARVKYEQDNNAV